MVCHTYQFSGILASILASQISVAKIPDSGITDSVTLVWVSGSGVPGIIIRSEAKLYPNSVNSTKDSQPVMSL